MIDGVHRRTFAFFQAQMAYFKVSLSVLYHADGSQNDTGGSGNGADDSEYKTQL